MVKQRRLLSKSLKVCIPRLHLCSRFNYLVQLTWRSHFMETIKIEGLVMRLLSEDICCVVIRWRSSTWVSEVYGEVLAFSLYKMGKNKRKRKLKEQDFKKVKLKVGKKLQPAQNATDTSFKSRAIFIPTQLNKDLEPTNQRNQTLKVAKLAELKKCRKGLG